MIEGLLTQKPGRDPTVGEVKNFTVTNFPAKGDKKAWTKIKNASPDQGGTPHRILSVKPTGHTDQYQNVSFNVQIEPAEGAAPSGQSSASAQSGGRTGAGNGYSGRSPETQARIERQHSQEMALRYFAMKGGIPEVQVAGKATTESLREMIDWFQRDIGHTPDKPMKAEPTSPEPAFKGLGKQFTDEQVAAGEAKFHEPIDDDQPF